MNTNIAISGDMFEWEDGNPDAEDRTGWTVAVNEQGLIRQARPGDVVLGAVAGSDDAVGFVANPWMNEWHAKHMRDWSGRLQYEKQELITWVRDGRREMHETDRLPPGLEIPEDAERWTHWPESGQRLERPVLNPRFNDGSQGFAVYQGRLHRQEWALIIVLGRAAVLHESEVDSRWIPLQGFSANGGSITGRLWFIR